MCEILNPTTNGESMSFAGAIPAKGTATPEASINDSTRISAVTSSGLLMHFARELWSEKIRPESVQTLFGPGGECDPALSRLATLSCPSDSGPVALGLTISGKGCSCLPSVPTPTASDWKGSTGKGSRRGTLAERVAMECQANGKTVSPHPDFVEALMGFPTGWTDCGASGIASIQKSRNGSGAE